jgi:integrase/recombinase XerD
MAASIYVREKQDSGWRYRRVREGRGFQTGSLTGPFFARAALNGKRAWHRLEAETFADAKRELVQLEAALAATAQGLTVAEMEERANANRVPLRRAIDEYLAQKSNKTPKTKAKYRQTLNRFVELSGVHFLDEITVDVLRRYKHKLEEAGYAPGTVGDHLSILTFLLKKRGIAARIPRDEMPVEDVEPALPYSNEELEKLFAVMDPEERIRYKFFLGTGCRDKEVTFASWPDLNLEQGTYTIRSKPDSGFTVKNHEQRTVPLPESLVKALKARKKNAPHSRWVFVNEDGRPDNHFLRKLKRLALRAGINCGDCHTTVRRGRPGRIRPFDVSCKKEAVCKHITLHRFRKTCATRWMEAGIPIRTIQHWLGHKELETTQRYLGVGNIETLRTQINAAFGD